MSEALSMTDELVRRLWNKGAPLYEIKATALLRARGGKDVMDVVRRLQLPERHPTTRVALADLPPRLAQ